MDVHLYVHLSSWPDLALIQAKLDTILSAITQQGALMATTLDDLKTQVQANTDAEASAVILLGQLHDLLQAAKSDPAKLDALLAQLATSKEALAAAIVANSPSA